MNRCRRLFILALTVALGAVAAGRTMAESTALKGDGGTVRLLVNPSGTQSFPAFVIAQRHLDQKYGFRLETRPSATTQTTTVAFQSGGADIGIMGWNDISRIKAGGVKVVGIAPFLGWATTLVTAVNAPFHTLGDLKGKKVGVNNRAGLEWTVMRALAQKVYHFDLEQGVVIQEAAIGVLQGLMAQNQIDATLMFNDLTAPLVVSGKFTVMARIQDFVEQLGLPDTPLLMYVADSDYAAAHPDNVRALLAAYRDSVKALQTDDALWTERATELNITDAAVVAAMRNGSRPMLMSAFTPASEADIRKTWDILLATAGAETLGMGQLVPGFMTLDYQ